MVDREHELKETISVDVWYPDHPPRKESATFAATRRELIEKGEVPCWVCGTKEKLEAHHFFVEWAYADGVDWEKMKTLHPQFDWSTFKEPEDFVDSVYNMVILCEVHHRHKNHGIHNLPYPIWIMQRNARADFVMFSPTETPSVPTPEDKS